MTQLPRTLYDRLIDNHIVRVLDSKTDMLLLYIDRTVLNEYTSPQAFSGLRDANRRVWRPDASLGVVDHVNPTTANRIAAMADPQAAEQVRYFAQNCNDFGIEMFDVLDPRQGIEHVVAPEQGLVLPGMVVAAGDSHTTTYGALGALGFGIGTSDIEHYLATQTLAYRRLKTMRVTVDGALPEWVTPKDVVMGVIGQIGADGATGFAVEFTGQAVAQMTVEGRMTLCNMIVEAGARGAIIAPDDKVFEYVANRPRSPKGRVWQQALTYWRTLKTDVEATFDHEVRLDASSVSPCVTWGTSPDQVLPVNGAVPNPEQISSQSARQAAERAIDYMGLTPGMKLTDIIIDCAFIGSCTNGRIEDIRSAAQIVQGRQVAPGVRAMVVPGSSLVRAQAEAEGLASIFLAAGFEWRQSGCSLCLAMNDDVLAPGMRAASSTNRNFEGRQGSGARTHLMSPVMVAAAAVTGRITDVRTLEPVR